MLTASPAGAARCRRILEGLPPDGLFAVGQDGRAPCRIGPEPFPLPRRLVAALERQGPLWLAYVRAAHRLYLDSREGAAPPWIGEWLDAGKPERLRELGRMNRFKSAVPPVLRPDLLLTDDGTAACELDAVPGGIGLLGCLAGLYAAEGAEPVGGADGMVSGFAAAMRHAAGGADPAGAIVVSEESAMYRPEMRWLAERLRAAGGRWQAVAPDALAVGDAGVTAAGAPVELVYRFFELFDLDRVPHGAELLEAARRKLVRLAPPAKAHLEEKLLFALLHHPALADRWSALLGADRYRELRTLVIPSWVLDPRPLPPHAVIAGEPVPGRTLTDWRELASLSQRERALVLKPSGFSEEAWGSHGVTFGFDLSQPEWAAALARALGDFPARPWILQPFRRPALHRVPYWDAAAGEIRELEGRVRLTPFYFVTGESETALGGVLATICPADKKAVHGMPDAVMLPCAAVGE